MNSDSRKPEFESEFLRLIKRTGVRDDTNYDEISRFMHDVSEMCPDTAEAYRFVEGVCRLVDMVAEDDLEQFEQVPLLNLMIYKILFPYAIEVMQFLSPGELSEIIQVSEQDLVIKTLSACLIVRAEQDRDLEALDALNAAYEFVDGENQESMRDLIDELDDELDDPYDSDVYVDLEDDHGDTEG
ncbi:MAG TPA: hypothetical protein VJA22_02410 [Patescibacteria group bacterium]|nr:hypothetical protein [Patescibacteria group bacterium]